MKGTATPTAAAIGRRRPTRGAWLVILPLFVWLLAFVIMPNVIMVVYSFLTPSAATRVEWKFTLDNYERFFFDPSGTYLKVAGVSVWYAFITTVICLAAGYPVAYFIGRASERWRNLLLMLVMIPFWTGFLIRTYAWLAILRNEGLLNGMLKYLHIISQPIEILYTPAAVVIGLVYSYLPFMILPIYGSVEKLDNSLIEAALDLGAGPVQAFYKVIVPLTFPGIAAGILLVFIPSIGMYAINDIMGGGNVDMIGNVIQQQIVGLGNNTPFGAAIGITLMVFFCLLFWLTNRSGRAEVA